VIQNAVTANISMLVRYSMQILLSLTILFILSWKLSLVMFSVVPIVAVGAVAYGFFVQKLQKRFQDQLAKATSTAEECLQSFHHKTNLKKTTTTTWCSHWINPYGTIFFQGKQIPCSLFS